MPYKDAEIRRQKARHYTAVYRARRRATATAPAFRPCLVCETDISHMRADAKFCCRDHKRAYLDARRDYKAQYEKHKISRRQQALAKYYKDVDKSRREQLARQKQNPALYAAHTAKRRAAILKRTPKWLTEQDFADIQKIYVLADELSRATEVKWHVDHIVPLQGKNVSGLHLPNNLQVLPANVNIAKHNKFEAA